MPRRMSLPFKGVGAHVLVARGPGAQHRAAMQPFSGLALLKRGLTGQRGWTPQWRSPQPKPVYDALIVGGGGHGLGTAYYLASEHRLGSVAVLEKGWIGGGNTGRNTTIIRSNYLFDESAALYDHALKLWEGLAQALNYNVMFSQRGVMMLAHTVHDMQVSKRHVHANRAADALGVDIIENCEVTAIRRDAAGAVEGVETTRGPIRARRVGVAAAGHTSVIMKMAGIELPLESYPLQALVSEPVKPVFPCVVMSNTIHAYISQSDKGELVIGAGTDAYTSYTQRGGLHITSHALEAICELFPMFRRLRMLRAWGGIVDVTPDRSPIIARTPVPGLYVNCGWGTGGFKATPGSAHVFAWTIAHDAPHALNAPFTLERFRDGDLIDEAAAAAVAH